jgi:hypothetical protein
MLQHTAHSALRSAQRGLNGEEIDYVFEYGARFHSGGALIYYLRRQDVPVLDQRLDWIMRIVGTALVVDRDDQVLLTTWRNRRSGLKLIRKQSKERHNRPRPEVI